MPTSDNVSVPYVSMILRSLAPASALDVGIGMGKFGFLYREAIEWDRIMSEGVRCIPKERWRHRLDGIEICSDYITPVQQYLYDHIFVGSAEDLMDHMSEYDLVHFGDVIEHFCKEAADRVLDAAFAKSRLGVLVVTPVGEFEQTGVYGNPHEEHRSVWEPSDFDRFPHVWCRAIAKRQWVICVTREPCSFHDPMTPRKTAAQIKRIERRHEIAKSAVTMFLGDRMLDTLRRLKRRWGGWRRPRWSR
jgi:hypothetical protein